MYTDEILSWCVYASKFSSLQKWSLLILNHMKVFISCKKNCRKGNSTSDSFQSLEIIYYFFIPYLNSLNSIVSLQFRFFLILSSSKVPFLNFCGSLHLTYPLSNGLYLINIIYSFICSTPGIGKRQLFSILFLIRLARFLGHQTIFSRNLPPL